MTSALTNILNLTISGAIQVSNPLFLLYYLLFSPKLLFAGE